MVKESFKQIEKEYKILSLKEELRKKKTDRLLRMITYATAIYSVMIMMFFLFKDRDYLTPLFSNPDSSDRSSELIEGLQNDVLKLREDLSQLNENIEKTSSDVILNTRINELESKQKALSETILYDPDKALTSRLLREKQATLEENIREIKTLNDRLSSKVDDFISKIITIPIFGFVLAIVTGLLTPIFNRIVEKIKGKGSTLS